MVVAFASITISTNLARDLGTRMVAAIFLDTSAFTYKSYSWIGILVNVPATLFAVGCTAVNMLMLDNILRVRVQGYHGPHRTRPPVPS